MKQRCPWAEGSQSLQEYHDHFWGRPVYDDQMLFRKLILDINQAGLSWQTILNKAEDFDRAYENFEIERVANFDEEKVSMLLNDKTIIRNQRKIRAAIVNAQQVLKLQKEFGSFSDYLWRFVDNTPQIGHYQKPEDVPATSDLSDELTKDLKSRGFRFIGSTTIYAFLQAVGIYNDHLTTCFCYEEINELNQKMRQYR